MQKLLNAYRADRTPANAAKLRAYAGKHPMAACMLSPDDTALLNAATKLEG